MARVIFCVTERPVKAIFSAWLSLSFFYICVLTYSLLFHLSSYVSVNNPLFFCLSNSLFSLPFFLFFSLFIFHNNNLSYSLFHFSEFPSQEREWKRKKFAQIETNLCKERKIEKERGPGGGVVRWIRFATQKLGSGREIVSGEKKSKLNVHPTKEMSSHFIVSKKFFIF